MDTTAAAELAVGLAGPGVDGIPFWVDGTGDQEPWSDDENFDSAAAAAASTCRAEWSKGNARVPFHRHARHSRPPFDLPPHKRPRNALDDAGRAALTDGGRHTNGDVICVSRHPNTDDAYGGDSHLQSGRSASVLSDQPGSHGYGDKVTPGDLDQAERHGYSGRPGSECGSQGYGLRHADTDNGGGGGGSAYASQFYGLPPDDFDNGDGSQSFRQNGYGSGNGGGLLKQGSMKGSNSFSGDMGSVVDSPNLASSTNGGSTAMSSGGKGKGTGSIFFKTKLCCKFRAGICPYSSNCNFAHGMEELRKPPPGWEEIVAAQEAERAIRGTRDGQVQVVMESTGSGASGEMQRFHKTPRTCRKFYTEDGCPYGDRCIFMHDEQVSQSRTLRESNAISLGPTNNLSNGGGNGGGAGADRPSNWKTRVCNKWETTGHCPFGQKCHFVHGTSDGTHTSNTRQGTGVTTSVQFQKPGLKLLHKWKGHEDEISTIYGDWIEDDEWEACQQTPRTKVHSNGKTQKIEDCQPTRGEFGYVSSPDNIVVEGGWDEEL